MSQDNDSTAATPLTNEYLDDRVFKFQVYFWNNDGRLVKIPKSTIQELVIQDNLLDWYHSGYMLFSNPKNVFERVTKKYTNGQETDVIPYRFRNDGRDYLYIEIDVPIQDDITSSESLNNEIFTIKLMCSIYNTEDVTGSGPDDKLKKVYFWDYRHQLMLEHSMFWSSAHAVKRQGNNDVARSLYLLDDTGRSVYTGDGIKDLITECLKTGENVPEFEEDFSKGGDKLFYTSPVDSKVSDDLDYLVSKHVHDNKHAEPCLLRVNRFTDKWSLLPISEYFKRAYISDKKIPGEYQLDKFYLGEESSPEEVSTNRLRTPDKSTAMNNFFVDANIINDFEFLEMSATDSTTFMNTTLVHMYDHETKQFNIQLEESDIDNTRTFMKENIIGNMLGGEGGVHPNIVLNKLRKNNKNVMSQFTTDANKVKEYAIGRNRTIMTAILAGNAIKFNAKGLPSRQAGRFIAIDRDAGYNENDFDDKILGQYLVTSVVHQITNKGYNNEVIGVKPYYFKDPEFNEEE